MEYKGIVWKNRSDLSIKLGHETRYVSHMITVNPNLTEEMIIDRHLSINTYRDINWKNKADLAEKLNVNRSSINHFLMKNPGKTIEDFIDYILDKPKEYRGIKWNNLYQLSLKLNVSDATVYRFIKCNPDKSVEDFIDMVLDKKPHNGSYRGLVWSTYVDLAAQLGKSDSFVRVWMKRNPDKSIEDCIDYVLKKGI